MRATGFSPTIIFGYLIFFFGSALSRERAQTLEIQLNGYMPEIYNSW